MACACLNRALASQLPSSVIHSVDSVSQSIPLVGESHWKMNTLRGVFIAFGHTTRGIEVFNLHRKAVVLSSTRLTRLRHFMCLLGLAVLGSLTSADS